MISNLSVYFGTTGAVPNDLVRRAAGRSRGTAGSKFVLGWGGLAERVLDRSDDPRLLELEAAVREGAGVGPLLLGHGLVPLGEPRRGRDHRRVSFRGRGRGRGRARLGVGAAMQYRHVEAVGPVAF